MSERSVFPQMLLEEVEAPANVHPQRLVEAGGSRWTIGIDVEEDPRHSPGGEGLEGAEQESFRDPSASPRAPNGDHVDPASVLGDPADGGTDDLLRIHRKRREHWIHATHLLGVD